MNKKIEISKEFLEKEYLINLKSSIEIAKQIGCAKPTILKYLKILDIKKRTTSESMKNRKKRGLRNHRFITGLIADKEWLYLQYTINKKTVKEISEISRNSISTIYKHLEYFNIPRRPRKEYVNMNLIKYGAPTKGIKRPDLIERNKKITFPGNLNGNWKGGISKLPYSFDFSKQLKEQIRKRDNYKCSNCGLTNEEHLITYDESLPIHHIDYNKQNCKEDNLITTCKQCNARANFNRNYWEDFYKNKIAQLNKEATTNGII
jgi:hypothetical protein